METALRRALRSLGLEGSSPDEVLRPIGRGAQCAAFRTLAKPFVCIKVSPGNRGILQREAKILAQIRSRLFPGLIEDGSHHGYIIEELIVGRSLAQIHPSFFVNNLPNITIGLAASLRVLAGLQPPIIHRDIKPNNLFWRNDSVTILDFGSAAIEGRWRPPSTKDGYRKLGSGRHLFQPLEQLADDPGQDRRVDVFAATALVFYALTGKVPYSNFEPALTDALKTRRQREVELRRILSPYSPRVRDALIDGVRVDSRHRLATFDPIASAIADSYPATETQKTMRARFLRFPYRSAG